MTQHGTSKHKRLFLCAPEAIKSAEKTLRTLGLLDEENIVTEIGKKVNVFPLNVRFGKMLLLADQGSCLEYLVIIVAALSVQDAFL